MTRNGQPFLLATAEHDDHQDHDHQHFAGAVEYIRLGGLGLVILSSLTAWWRNFMGHDWLAFAATVLGVFPIYAEAWENLRKRRMTMEISMMIALVAALCIGQFLSGDLIWGHIFDI